MQTQVIKSRIILEVPLQVAFKTFFKFDFLQVFKKLWFVRNFNYLVLVEKGLRPGYEYKIYFDNGDTAILKLNTFLSEMSFSASVYNFSFLSWSGLRSIDYLFNFSEDLSNGLCTINCEYHFRFRRKYGVLLFNVFARKMICRNLDKVLAEKIKTEIKIKTEDQSVTI